ncbi:hypothetical protein [Denitromonas sp.]|uniref:hypothetical protein n=1 Tax=Denitromonas sp. TaxID=2734609 RepID=UPI001DBCA788|nr:hypothetical protein [Rhodocyclaceae bacterium]HQU88800.1 hypothetical protein [Denitromonas sp.]
MKHWRRGIGALCLGLSLVVSAPASAAVPRVDLGLAQSQSICDGKATYKYVVSWKARGGSREYQVNSGNKCQLAGRICGISSKTCYTQCSASGDCRAEVGACQVGRGAPWIQAYATDGSGYQRITALAPSRCQ